jgi:acyl-coenzyme A thioesterase PaaI-like protein
MTAKAIQDYYPDEMAVCYGCGRLNQHGLQIKSYWDGDETVCRFQPKDYHIAFPGYVYGGLIASLIDCHATGTAASAKFRDENKSLESEPLARFVTLSLHVDYLAPTPIQATLELHGRVKEIKGRKAVISVTLSAEDKIRARAEVVTLQMPDDWLPSA